METTYISDKGSLKVASLSPGCKRRFIQSETDLLQFTKKGSGHFKPPKYSKSNEAFHNIPATPIDSVEYKVSNKKRAIWMTILLTVLIASCATCVWLFWKRLPSVIGYSEELTPALEVPFPAMTICSETKFKKSLFDYEKAFKRLHYAKNMLKAKSNMSGGDAVKLLHALQVCQYIDEVDRYHLGQEFSNEKLYDLEFLAPKMLDMLLSGKWRNEQMEIDEIFHPIWTDEGLCYTLNSVQGDEMFTQDNEQYFYNLRDLNQSAHWTLEGGYRSEIPFDAYPSRAVGGGERNGIKLTMNSMSTDLDGICSGMHSGFRVAFHMPNDLARMSQSFIRIPLDQATSISIRPKLLMTDPSLKSLTPEKRMCFFNEERSLRYFKSYTMNNCEIECLANFTMRSCGCVKFTMPRVRSMQICGASKLKCVRDAEASITANQFIGQQRSNYICNCLPACTFFEYETSVVNSPISWAKFMNGLGIFDLETMFNWKPSRLIVQLREDSVETRRRFKLNVFGDETFIVFGFCCILIGVLVAYFIIYCIKICKN